MMRGSCVPVTWPKVPSLRPLSGPVKLVWLKTLKDSARIWRLVLSPIAKFFIRPRSTFSKPGPRIFPADSLPK